MALLPFVFVCSAFMLGRNVFSLFFKILDLFKSEKKAELKEDKRSLFVFILLIITAVAGLICGIGLLIPNQVFGFYLFFIVSGMMIYSYFTYAGITFSEKNWFMFVVCCVVIALIIALSITLAVYMSTGIID